MLLPDTETVAEHFLLSLPNIPASGVSTELPVDNSTWAASGYVVITNVVDNLDIYTTLREPVISLDVYAVNPDSGKAPYWKANALAERIVEPTLPTYTGGSPYGVVALPPAYGPARVLGMNVIRAPYRKPGNQGSYAVYSMDVQLFWVRL